MKAIEVIIKELNENEFFPKNYITEKHPEVQMIIEFYNKYPQYSELKANAIWWILQSIRTKNKPVSVHEFDNGSIWFVGDIITSKNAPIASIGDWTSVDGWEKDLINHSKVIDKIIWNF